MRNNYYLCPHKPGIARLQGEMAERSIVAVSKTVEGHTSGGSNPSLSAKPDGKIKQNTVNQTITVFFLFGQYAKKGVLEHLKRTKSVTLLFD